MVGLRWIWLIIVVTLKGRFDFLGKCPQRLRVSPVASSVVFVYLDVPLLKLQHAVELL